MAGYTGWKYAYAGPPFNWLGHFSLSQWQAMQGWISARQEDIPEVSTFHRIRAEQLRKTAGVLEQYYSSVYPDEEGSYDEALAPTFQKPVWAPGPYGHFNQAVSDDHLPMVMVGRIKKGMQDMFQRHDDAVYYMNQVRCLIEKHEDLAQYASDFAKSPAGGTQTNPRNLAGLISKINSYFSKPEYQTVLVDDVNQSNMYEGQPYTRVNNADPPTQWELEQFNHSLPSDPIMLKDTGTIDPTTATI
jgi:hypothetical protein